jgi:glycogen synthase
MELPNSNSRTRVLLFVNSIAIGGMEEHVKLIARHLDRSQLEVFAIGPTWEPIRPFNEALARVADHFMEITPDRRVGMARLPLEIARFTKQLRDWRIDVAHFHSTTYRGQAIAFGAAQAAGVRRIFVTEHLAPEAALPPREKLWRDTITRLLTGVVCVSHKNYVARAKHLYTPLDKTYVVANGVDTDDFQPTPASTLAELRKQHDIPDGAEVVGTAVRFEPEKGLEYLMDAFATIKAERPKALLLMVGDGSLRKDLEAHAERLGLASSVRWAGFQRDCKPYYSLMDAFVLPVPFGSMSIGLLEAMAMRCAAVITFGGEGEAIVHGECGFCAEPRSPKSISDHVIRILAEPGLRERFGRAARTRVETAFSAQRVARVLGSLYRGEVPAGVRPNGR